MWVPSKTRHILLMGPPGAGKGTQAELLKTQLPDAAHLALGELLRTVARQQTPLSRQISTYLDKGKLLPDRLVCEMVLDYLRTVSARWIIWDGFPRSEYQMKWLECYLKAGHARHKLVVVVWLEIELAQIKKRITARLTCLRCGYIALPTKIVTSPQMCSHCRCQLSRRSDDYPAQLAHRMNNYRRSTLPLRVHYQFLGLLQVLDATRPPKQLVGEIKRIKSVKKELRTVFIPSDPIRTYKTL